ncbi:hypothetical protein ACFV08_01730 [Streptomyces fradiae]|uniref:hypothetical protein n=1 Tax=Streptomyces fradiae TaxID=1906 RepID=UPI00368B2833
MLASLRRKIDGVEAAAAAMRHKRKVLVHAITTPGNGELGSHQLETIQRRVTKLAVAAHLRVVANPYRAPFPLWVSTGGHPPVGRSGSSSACTKTPFLMAAEQGADGHGRKLVSACS